MILAALLSAINKLLNYPILGKKFGYLYVNKLTTNFLILNIIVILIWYFVFKMIILVPILLIITLLLQILFLSYKYIYMPAKNKTQKNKVVRIFKSMILVCARYPYVTHSNLNTLFFQFTHPLDQSVIVTLDAVLKVL